MKILKAFKWAAVVAALVITTGVIAPYVVAQSYPMYTGTNYGMVVDTQRRCVIGWATTTLSSSVVCQEGALLWRIDENKLYTMTSGSWTLSTLTGNTMASPAISGTVSGGATYTTPTLTSPVVTGSASSGLLVTKRCTITEDATNTAYNCTIAIPAGAVIEDIQVIGRVLWNGTSASMLVGDTADPNGYFDTVDLKATDLVIGEMMSIKHSAMWGGNEGAYLVAATGRRGPTSSNFSLSYVAGSNIVFNVTEGAADGTAGRTDCVVIYSTPETVAVTN